MEDECRSHASLKSIQMFVVYRPFFTMKRFFNPLTGVSEGGT